MSRTSRRRGARGALVICGLVFSAGVASSQTIKDGGPLPGGPWRAQTADKPWSLSQAGEAYRFEIRAGDHRKQDGDDSLRRRSELTGLSVPAAGYVAISYDINVQPAPFAGKSRYTFGQLQKGKDDPGDVSGEHAIAAFRLITGGRPSFVVSGSDQKPLKAIPKAETVWTGAPEDFKLGLWHHVQIVLMQGGSSAFAELWIDGKRKGRRDGPVGYSNTAPAVLKIGVYDPLDEEQTTVVTIKKIEVSLQRPGESRKQG